LTILATGLTEPRPELICRNAAVSAFRLW